MPVTDSQTTRTDELVRSVIESRRRVAGKVSRKASLDRAGLDQWASAALAETVKHASLNSPFYSSRIPWSLAAAVAADTAAFQTVPFTYRQDLAEAYPLGMLAVPPRDVTRFDESSGTGTGQPVAAFFTAEDWTENNLIVAHLLSTVLDSTDVVAIAVPYELAGVGQDLDRAVELLGCTIVPLGAASPLCSPERMVRALHHSGATTLICSGTRALLLGEVARRCGIDPHEDLAVTKILMAGEGASPAKRARLADQWDASTYSMFGMTETNTLAMFCAHQDLHLVETRSFFEIVEPRSGQLLPDGEAGELTVTTLASQAMPLLRYRTGDTCLIEAAPCVCGSPLRRLRHRGRLGDRISVGHGLASQLEIEDVVLAAMHQPPFFFAFDVDGLILDVALPPGSSSDPRTRESITMEVAHRFGATARFSTLNVEEFERALRTSAKPTMRNFLTTREVR